MILHQTSQSSDVYDQVVPLGMRTYMQEQLKNALYQEIMKRFLDLEDQGCINRAQLARRIEKKPEQITRWLGASGNLTLRSVSDLLAGLECEVDINIRCKNAQKRNCRGPEWLTDNKVVNFKSIRTEKTNESSKNSWTIRSI